MTSAPLFSIAGLNSLDPRDRETLLTILSSHVALSERRHRAVDLGTVLALLKDLGSAASAITAMVKLAQELNKWRLRVRNEGRIPTIELQRPKTKGVKLDQATDEEIAEWLSQSLPSRPESDRPA